MAEPERLICASGALADGGRGIRFGVQCEQEPAIVPAFVIRYRGKVHAYLNRCAHVGIGLDWMEGEFFDDSGLYLICSMHGAVYTPENGVCVGGPCSGKSLQSVAIEERDGNVFLLAAAMRLAPYPT